MDFSFLGNLESPSCHGFRATGATVYLQKP